MRRPVLLFLILNLAIVGFLIHSVWTLLTLLVVDGSEDAISRAELPAPGSDLIDGRTQLIPKIIHQTYINESIPEVWQEPQKSCIELHKDWEYKLWTDALSREFIAAEYPWFLETFDNYEYPIQRADSIRYFVLAHYGGIYLDLDDGCNRRLDPLLSYPAWVRRTLPTGISNDAMGSVPRHPFFLRVIDDLPRYNRKWVLPYITVMASTGPLFLSIIWRHWSSEGLNIGDGPDGGRVRILFPDEYNYHPWSFFTHHLGNSWHSSDVKLIFWMLKHWVMLTVVGFLTAGVVFAVSYYLYNRFFVSHRPWAMAVRKRFPMGLFRRLSSGNVTSKRRQSYELVRRDEEDAM
ncbi:putative MIPC synthase subunit [Aureobasidium sp. EXF-8845]|nr:putative MIPC synthase subunit [Aureobasidium sp. EXF-8846]KAI4838624.1 putative MIPC synthase subunit [Aureobasidium sp. EXF-8845]